MSDAPLKAMHVESWAAVSIDTSESEPQRFGAYADDSVIPAAQRRRLSAFARMAVACGLSVSGADCSELVFCSRYGDLHLAYRLLVDLVDGVLLSPAAFSLSVHNSVPGVMDLVRKSRVGHTAVAGGEESLSAGLAESWGKLNAKSDGKVTLIYAEAHLPDEIDVPSKTGKSSDQASMAIAMTLSAKKPANCDGIIGLAQVPDSGPVLDGPASYPLATAILSALGSSSGLQLQWRSRGLLWSMKAGPDAAR